MLALPPALVTPPSGAVVTLAAAKAHLRVDHDLDDSAIGALIAAAEAHLDGYGGILGRCLLTQTWRDSGREWPASRCLPLQLSPVSGVVSVTARDGEGTVVTLTADSDYRLISGLSYRPFLFLERSAALPSLACEPDALSVTYTAGYGRSEDVPAPIRHAILLMVGDMYRFTESAGSGQMASVPMSTTVERLLAPYRRVHL